MVLRVLLEGAVDMMELTNKGPGVVYIGDIVVYVGGSVVAQPGCRLVSDRSDTRVEWKSLHVSVAGNPCKYCARPYCADALDCLDCRAMANTPYPTDTSLDFDDEPTHPGFGMPMSIWQPNLPRSQTKNGDHLPGRKCKKCKNERMHASLQHDEWRAFCKLCSHSEAL